MAPNSSSNNPDSSVSLGDSSSSADIVQQARGRSDGFDMGSDRAIPNPPNWNAQASQQLYAGAVNNNDPGTAEATGQAWAHHGNELKQASDHLYNAITELGAAWIGQGAGAAQGALVAIANSGAQASEAAHTMSDRLAKQAAAAAEVKKMPAPKEFDPKQAMAAALAGGPDAMAADQKAQFDAANDVKTQQVAFFDAYTKAMSEVDNSTPSFGPESLGMKPTAGHNSVSFSSIGNVAGTGPVQGLGAADAYAGQGLGASGFGGHGAQLAGHSGPGGPLGGHGAVGGVGGVGVGPDGSPLAGAGGTGTAAAASASGAQAPTSSGSGGLGGIGKALGLGALGGGLGYAGARTLGAGNRSGSKKQDDSTEAASNSQQQAQSAAAANAPQQGVVSSGGTIGGQPTPPPNMNMGGGMGAHGAHAEQEEEHTHASFLIEADPDEAFGANQATPPPVIGAWTEDEDR